MVDTDGHNVWDVITGAIGQVLNTVPAIVNLPNNITNAVISPFTSYRFENLLEPIQPDDNNDSRAGASIGTVGAMLIPGGNLGRLAEAGEVLAGGAQNAIAAPLLSDQLTREAASSVFTEDGFLTNETLKNSREIIPASDLGNPRLPPGVSKFSTQTFRSPAGDFQMHFYMNSKAGVPFYDLDYKAIFTKGFPSK